MTKKQTPDELLGSKHSTRWRKYGNGVPRMVATAFGGDIATPLAMKTEDVFAKVDKYGKRRGWEKLTGLKAMSFPAVRGKLTA